MAIALPCVFVSCDKDDEEEPYDVVIDFQDVNILQDPGYIENAGAGLDGIFTEGIISFPNYYNTEYNSWSGFAYSQMHDVATPGYANQYSVYALNDPQENRFMVAFLSDPADYSPKGSFTFSQPVKDLSFDVANTTYAALAMMNGHAPAEKFTDTDDWFKLMVQFYDANGSPLFFNGQNPEPREILLAQGTQILNTWIHISTIAEPVSKIEFSLVSTDNGDYGMNTPAYFCIDNIKARIVK
ncbi:MAG: DUF4465 domain-containing protein [Bacteroidales bacterium]|nr:DUF4465 domain-containing protein [Bacteroidales bacterium]